MPITTGEKKKNRNDNMFVNIFTYITHTKSEYHCQADVSNNPFLASKSPQTLFY